MKIDLMVGSSRWADTRNPGSQGRSSGTLGDGLHRNGQTPWLSIAAAATAAPSLIYSTGIAVAFGMSPMVAASLAWDLADNTGGRFRLGLGSQVRAHIERRYGAEFDPPVGRMRDYIQAVKATLAAFRGDTDLAHDGPKLQTFAPLPDQWRPLSHGHGDIKVDVSAVGPAMARWLARWPMASMSIRCTRSTT